MERARARVWFFDVVIRFVVILQSISSRSSGCDLVVFFSSTTTSSVEIISLLEAIRFDGCILFAKN